MALRFIHCADLHLGTLFKAFPERYGNESELTKTILCAPEKALDKITECAIENKVDFVIFAGDIMDSVNANWRSISVFAQAIRRLKAANIPSFVIAGNHDPLPDPALEKACSDAILFKSDGISYYEIPGKAVIAGVSFCEEHAAENLALKFKRQNPDLFHIAIYHADIGGSADNNNVYNPAPLSDLINSGFDYWALGHIHEKTFLSESNPVILYSGATVSHHINELSPKGFYLVEADDFKNVKTEFVECGTIVFARLEIDMNGIEDINHIPYEVKKQINSLHPSKTAEKYFIELILHGRTILDKDLRSQKDEDLCYFIASQLADKYKLGNIEIKTSSAIDTETFVKNNIFASDLHQSFKDEKESSFQSIEEELTILQRAYGTLIDRDGIELAELAENAEYELMRLLTEDGK